MTDQTDQTDQTDHTERRLQYRVPATVEDMKPPKPANITAEAKAFLRVPEYYEVAKPFLQAISGEAESIHGSIRMDEAAYVFKVQEIAKNNGFAFLGRVDATELRLALRRAFKSNTGIAVKLLEKQRKRLLIEG